jgi:hypothetical protein
MGVALRLKILFCQTVNIGKFEAVRPGIELEDEAEEGEDLHALYLRIREAGELLFEKELNAQVAFALERRDKNTLVE